MKLLGKKRICDIVHEVWLASKKEVPDLKEKDGFNSGCAMPWFGKIYVLEGTPPDLIPAVVRHESVHCMIYHSGLAFALRDVFKIKRYAEVEETIVQALTPWLEDSEDE